MFLNKKIALSFFAIVVIAGVYYINASPLKYYFMEDMVLLPIMGEHYSLQKSPRTIRKNTSLNIPNFKDYTHDELLKKIPPLKSGRISLQLLSYIDELEKFSETERLAEFSKLQNRDRPRVITITSGIVNLEDIDQKISDPQYIEKINDSLYILKVPLLVGPNAGLIISGNVEDPLQLRMSANSGGFLVNAGKLFVIHADLSGWDEEDNDYAWYKEKASFRPFFASWSGSETYFSRSAFKHLGYGSSKSYGITFSIDNDMLKVNQNLSRPKGWIIESLFEEIYYGFYSYEADDIAIIGNIYKDNIVYGIDPHDRSNRLIIAYNEVFGTKSRHGIIVSREVNDSWIMHNRSHDNKGSGIMLDRSSEGNVIAMNESFDNGSDGLTFFESPHNSVYGNKIYGNKKSGMRLRNSWNIVAWDNNIHDNRIAVEVYASHIQSETRNMEEDPYTYRADITLIGGEYRHNTSGVFKFKNFDYFRFKNVSALTSDQKIFTADLKPFKRFMPPLLIQKRLNDFEFIATGNRENQKIQMAH